MTARRPVVGHVRARQDAARASRGPSGGRIHPLPGEGFSVPVLAKLDSLEKLGRLGDLARDERRRATTAVTRKVWAEAYRRVVTRIVQRIGEGNQ